MSDASHTAFTADLGAAVDAAAATAAFPGDSDMARCCRALDWAATPLGPVGGWSLSLRAAVAIVLTSRQPMFLWWGPELVQLYNDAYRPSLGAGGRAERALGARGRPFWTDIWDVIGPQIAQVLDTGAAVWHEDRHLPIERDGHLEDVWWTYSFSPARDDDGRVAGVLVVCQETTGRVRAEAALRESAARFRALATAGADALYRMSPDWGEMRELDGRGFLSNTPLPSETWLTRYIHPEDRERVLAAIAAAIGERRTFELEHRVVRADGSLGWVHSRAVPLLDAAGAITEWVGAGIDVTARKAAEAALQASEERQAFLLTLSDAVQPLTDPVAIQETAARVLGEHLGTDRAYYAHYDWDLGVAVVARDFFRGEAPSVVGEHPLASFAGSLQAHRDGVLVLDDVEDARSLPLSDVAAYRALSVRAVLNVVLEKKGVWVASMTLLHAVPHHWTHQEIALLKATAERTWDAVERAHAAAALRRSEEHLRLATQAARFYSWDVDVATGRSRISANADEVQGSPIAAAGTEEALLQLQHLTLPEDAAALAAALERTIGGGGDLHREFRVHHPRTGETLWFEAHATLVAGSGGMPARVSGVARNVTAHKRAEAALRESEARYRTLVENVRDYAIFLLDAEGRVAEWTAGAARATGYGADEAVGLPLARLYTPEDAAAGVPAAHLAEVAAAGRGEWEGWRVRKDGARFWANEIATAVRDGDGTVLGFTKISRDLTERRLAEQAAEQVQRQAARDALRRALAAAEEGERQRLARELHDQLGQELTAFRLGLDDARRLAATHDGARAGPDAPLLGRLAQLQALAQRLTGGARYLALELRPPELDDLGLESALETYVREWGARYGVAAEVAVTGLRGRTLRPDVTSTLYRIAQEALTNVAKHAGARQVSVIVEQPDGEVRLIVEDDGRGFDSQATDARVRRERRLGLAGMRERAALVGGTVAVESSPGAGATVYVRLPVDHPLDAGGTDPGGTDPGGTDPGGIDPAGAIA